jgi:hypothetical protein
LRTDSAGVFTAAIMLRLRSAFVAEESSSSATAALISIAPSAGQQRHISRGRNGNNDDELELELKQTHIDTNAIAVCGLSQTG